MVELPLRKFRTVAAVLIGTMPELCGCLEWLRPGRGCFQHDMFRLRMSGSQSQRKMQVNSRCEFR